ncbi:hypothetical protein HmCmsJML188_02104 [Escherichia coli]|nr:hypothetical protein HmCmsJML188_02104 [Escherichia coli]
MLCDFVIDVILRRHHCAGINTQLNGRHVTDNNDHAAGLRTSGAFSQFRLIAFRHIGDRNQCSGIVIQTKLTHPEAAHFWRYNQFSHDIVFILIIHADFIQGMTPDLMHQLRLTGIRHRQFAITVTHGHCRQVYFFPAGNSGGCQLRGSGSSDNGFKFRAHCFSLIRDKQ